jgi:hypothetical protein
LKTPGKQNSFCHALATGGAEPKRLIGTTGKRDHVACTRDAALEAVAQRRNTKEKGLVDTIHLTLYEYGAAGRN